jgi:hypothetical protein
VFKKFIFYFLGISHLFCFAQKNDSSLYVFKQAEKELFEIQKQAFHSRKEADRIEGNKKFIAAWDHIVSNPNILNYPFETLKDISVLVPKDKKFMIITWNLHRDDGTHAFFGYLLVNNSKRIKKGFMKHETVEEYEYFRLLDRSATVKSPENYIGSPEKWFGMLYTQLVECDGFYTLIGWDGNDKLTQRKFVDVLYFRANGDPVFGKDVFKFPRKNPKRLMFEYSSEVTMSLKYNEKRDLILFHHLVPRERDGAMENQYQFYGPDAQFDALQLKHDKWVLLENVEANSDIDPIKESKKPDPKKQNPVYTPK